MERHIFVEQWCAWVDDKLYLEGSERTRWARNFARYTRLEFGVKVGDRDAYGQAVVDVARGIENDVDERIDEMHNEGKTRVTREVA